MYENYINNVLQQMGVYKDIYNIWYYT